MLRHHAVVNRQDSGDGEADDEHHQGEKLHRRRLVASLK
jgi:hypothetical protein